MSDLHDILAFNRRHSNFQIDRLILCRSGVTPFGLYKQAAREVRSRYETLIAHYLSIQEAAIEVAESERALPAQSGGMTRDKLKVIRARMKIQSLESDFANETREFSRMLAHAVALKKEIGPLDPERLEQLDREEWFMNKRRMIALERGANGRLSQNTLDDIMAFEPKERKSLLEHNETWGESLAWLTQHEHRVAQLPALVSIADVKREIEKDVARLGLAKSNEIPSGSSISTARPAAFDYARGGIADGVAMFGMRDDPEAIIPLTPAQSGRLSVL